MAKNSAAALQRALSKPQPAVRTEPAAPTPAAYYMAPSRTGKVAINVYLEADYKRSLRLLQAHSGRSLQAIISEALNDAFAKHGVPTVSVSIHAQGGDSANNSPTISARKAKGKPRRRARG